MTKPHPDARVEVRTDDLWIAVGEGALDETALREFVADESSGAVASFVGQTRRWTDGRETVRLEYEAYPEMALAELRKIASEAASEWAVGRAAVHHRLGEVPVGGASVAIAVAAPHRDAAFAACRYIIDELKRRVPIWKKEHFADGGSEWVQSAG